MKIYIAGPYSAETHEERLENTHQVIETGIELIHDGHYPFLPHLTHFVQEYAVENDRGIEYKTWMDYDEVWLRECDAILHLESSPGADQELEVAKEIGLEVYHNLSEIPTPTS